MRTLEWVDDHIDVVDQTALPQWRRVRLETVDDVVDAPPEPTALNPAFDVTPADLVTTVVTETRVLQPGLSG